MASDLFKEASKYFSLEAVDIDNWSFKLFSKVTVAIFVASAVISAYFGSPIVCKSGDAYAEQLCWLHGARNYYSKAPDACFLDSDDKGANPGTEYYIWVSMVLFLNGVFYMVDSRYVRAVKKLLLNIKTV